MPGARNTTSPPEAALRFTPSQGSHVPEEYAVELNPAYLGGCRLWSRYRGEPWVTDASPKALVLELIRQKQELEGEVEKLRADITEMAEMAKEVSGIARALGDPALVRMKGSAALISTG